MLFSYLKSEFLGISFSRFKSLKYNNWIDIKSNKQKSSYINRGKNFPFIFSRIKKRAIKCRQIKNDKKKKERKKRKEKKKNRQKEVGIENTVSAPTIHILKKEVCITQREKKMIYGVVIVSGTGTLLFEKTWAQLPAHSRVFESKVQFFIKNQPNSQYKI